MNSISKCGMSAPANEKKTPFSQLSFQNISVCADSCSCFPHKCSWCLHSSRSCSAGTYFMAQSCVVAPHTHFIQKGAANSPQNVPWSWIFSWTLKFWVSCETCGLWVSVKEGVFFYNKAVRFGVFFPSNNYFLSQNQTAKAFSCHNLTWGFCFPPVDAATSKGSGGSCVLCSLLMSSPRL